MITPRRLARSLLLGAALAATVALASPALAAASQSPPAGTAATPATTATPATAPHAGRCHCHHSTATPPPPPTTTTTRVRPTTTTTTRTKPSTTTTTTVHFSALIPIVNVPALPPALPIDPQAAASGAPVTGGPAGAVAPAVVAVAPASAVHKGNAARGLVVLVVTAVLAAFTVAALRWRARSSRYWPA